MNQTEIDELRRLASVSREPRHGIGCIASDCALASAARNALPALLDAAEERDALLRIINDSFLSLNNPTSTLAFDGRNLVPHVEEASRYAEILRLERDALKAKLAALVKASQPFANDQGCDGVHHGYTDRHDQRETCPVVARLRDALAAAKVQP